MSLFDYPPAVPKISEIQSMRFDELARHIELSKRDPSAYKEVAQALIEEEKSRSPDRKYTCQNCGGKTYAVVPVPDVSGSAVPIVALAIRPMFSALVCTHCRYSVLFYRE
jgi:hypothetical protein